MSHKELLDLFISENRIFKDSCSDFRPGETENSIILYLETGDKLEVRYNAENKQFCLMKEFKEIMELHERVIDFKLYKALDNLYEIESLYGDCSIWDKSNNVYKAREMLKGMHMEGYEQYVEKNDH